jgi:hypothetical protein
MGACRLSCKSPGIIAVILPLTFVVVLPYPEILLPSGADVLLDIVLLDFVKFEPEKAFISYDSSVEDNKPKDASVTKSTKIITKVMLFLLRVIVKIICLKYLTLYAFVKF